MIKSLPALTLLEFLWQSIHFKACTYLQMQLSKFSSAVNSAPQKLSLTILFLNFFSHEQAWRCYFVTCLVTIYFLFVFCMISAAILETVLFVFLYHRASLAITYINFLFCIFLKNFFGDRLHRFCLSYTFYSIFSDYLFCFPVFYSISTACFAIV